MRHTLLAILVATAACGGAQKSTTAPPPLTDPKATDSETKPEEKPAPPPKPEPPPAPVPIDISLSAPTVSVKLVSPGKGKKSPLRFTPKQGAKQDVEVALDFAGKQAGPPEAGGTQEDVAPTLLLTGEAEVKNVDKDGAAEFELSVSHTDTRDVPNQKTSADDVKKLVELLKDLKIGGTVAANGSATGLKLHLDKGDPNSGKVLGLLSAEFLPTWPVLPAEPVGVGAKWQVVATTKFADKIEVTQTTDYELVDHKGTTWTIKGTTKVAGQKQDIGGATASDIKGTGTIEVALADGALYPKITNQLSTGFTATITQDPSKPPLVITFDLKQGTAVTPK